MPDVAAVTSPPYDVIDPDSATHLEELDPHNVVRLILPREEADDSRGRYEHAAARLSAWQAEGYLRRDDTAAIYVYEQSREPDLLQRGLLAAVELRDPDERVVLPHEDVMPGPVADRLELMRATQANLEPILLVYEGGGETVGVIDATAAQPALVETVTEDGIRHRLWALTEPAALAAVEADLQPRQALIADGHHRYATYRRLQAEQHDAGRGAGPWDRGLALLVDSGAYPLDLQAIHRVVEGLPLDEAVKTAGTVFTARDLGQDEQAATSALQDATGARVPAQRRRVLRAAHRPRPVAPWLRRCRRCTPPSGATWTRACCTRCCSSGCGRCPTAAPGCAICTTSTVPSGRPAASVAPRSCCGRCRSGGDGRGRHRGADAAQVHVVRAEAPHRAGPAPARRLRGHGPLVTGPAAAGEAGSPPPRCDWPGHPVSARTAGAAHR